MTPNDTQCANMLRELNLSKCFYSMNCCIPQDFMCLQDKFCIGRLAFAVILFLKIRFIYLFMTMLGLCCCIWVFSSCDEQGLISSPCCEQASHCSGFSCSGAWTLGTGFSACSPWAQQLHVNGLQSTGSVAVARGLSCPMAYRIVPDQEQNPCPLH